MALTLAPLGAMQTAKKWPYSPKVGAAPSLWIDATNTPTNLVSTLSGLVSWFDGKDSSTLALSGSNVTQWSDKSPSNANLTQNIFYTSPTYSSGTNLMSVGSPINLAISYPGNTFSSTSAWAMFFIVNPDPTKPGFLMGTKGICNGGYSNAATTNVLGIGAKNGGGITFPADGRVYFTPGEFQYPGQFGAPNNSSFFQSTSPVSSGLQLWSMYYDGSTLYFNVNGTQNSSSAGSYGMTSINATSSLIGFLDGSTNGLNPPLPVMGTNGIGEMVFYNTNLTPSSNYQFVEGYLAWKWGLQGSLPGGHPYKNSAPTYTYGGSTYGWAPSINLVTTITDFSGNGVSVTQTGATNLINSMNGLPGFSFIGNNWFTGSLSANALTAYVVYSMSSSAVSNARILSLGLAGTNDNGTGRANIIRSGSGPNIACSNTSFTVSATSTDNSVMMASLWFDGTNANLSTNATPENSTANSTTLAISNFSIGQNVNTSNSTPFNGYIGEVIIFDYVLTKMQRQQVEGYLAKKWKITVPSLHPYYNIPVLNQTFQPIDIPTCGLWLDSADTLSMTIGSTINQWNDKSGLGNHLTTGNSFSLARPSYNPATNIVTFGGSSNMSFTYNYYAISGSVWRYSWALFFVVNPDPTKSTFLMGADNNLSPYPGGLIASNVLGIGAYSERSTAGGRNCSNPVYTGNGHVYFQTANNTGWGSAGGFFDSGASVSAGLQVWSLVYNGTNITLFINGTSFASVATDGAMRPASDLDNHTSNIGDWYDNSNPNLSNNANKGNASVGEMVFYNTDLTPSSNYQTVEGFLAWKWGLQGSLPGGHPYKNSAPTYSGQPWAPRITGTNTISGLVSWFDGKDPLALNLNPTAAVLAWNDKSGGGYNTIASGAPSLSNNGVTFDRGSMALPTPAPYSQTSTIFMVANAKVLTGGGNDINSTYYNGRIPYFGLNTYQSGGVIINGIVYMTSPFTFSYKIGYRSPSGVASGFEFPPLNPPTNLYCPTTAVCLVKTNGASALGYGNGVLNFTAGDDGSGTATSIISISGDGLGFGLDGVTINEFILYNSALTINQVRQVEAYLAWKWRLQGSFPTTHPAYTLPAYGVVFTPKQLPGCALWFDAADTASMTFSGTSVTRWNDKSGNDYNATSTDYTPPEYSATGFNNGYPGLFFNGSTTLLNTPAFSPNPVLATNGTDTTIFIVMNRLSTGVIGGYAAYGLETDVNSYAFRDPSSSPSQTFIDIGLNGSDALTSSNTAIGPQLYSLGRTGGTVYMYAFSSLLGSVSRPGATGIPSLSQKFCIGGSIADNSYFNSYISELIIYNQALTTDQRWQVEGYLAQRWGLVNSLPSSHAYKKIMP